MKNIRFDKFEGVGVYMTFDAGQCVGAVVYGRGMYYAGHSKSVGNPDPLIADETLPSFVHGKGRNTIVIRQKVGQRLAALATSPEIKSMILGIVDSY